MGLKVFMMALVKVRPVSKDRLQSFIDAAVKHTHVTHMSRLVGKYDYLLQIAATDIVAFDTTLDELKQAGEGVIAEIELASVIDSLKTDDFSGLV